MIEFLLKFMPLIFLRYHTYRIEKFLKSIVKDYDKPGKKLLDIGAGELPYKKLFKHVKYYSADLTQNKSNTIDFVGDLNEGILGIKSNHFDYIICTQVLEHIKRPHVVFKEFSRVLKLGGKLFLTTHMVFDLHMIPNDYFRFTKYGLKALGEDVGLKLVHVEPHGGVFHVLSYFITALPIKILFKRDSFLYYLYLVVFFIPILIFNIFIFLLDLLDREKTLTINYECIYEKV